jgi:hypothetical protein
VKARILKRRGVIIRLQRGDSKELAFGTLMLFNQPRWNCATRDLLKKDCFEGAGNSVRITQRS